MREYKYKCLKCGYIYHEAVEAKNMDEACAELQFIIKAHDLGRHGSDHTFPKFKILRITPEYAELEEERRRVQCKLTDICCDLWDAADDYGVDLVFSEDGSTDARTTLRNLITKLAPA